MPIATRSYLGRAKVVTSRELSLDTAAVVEDVVNRDKPVIITKHGRLIAALVSLPASAAPEAEILASPAAQAFMNTLDAEGSASTGIELLDDGLCEDEPGTRNSGPDASVRLPRASVVTMRRLNQQTGAVLNEVRSRRGATLLSKHGRLIAALVPVPADIESQLLDDLAAQALTRSLGSETRDGVAYGVSPEEALEDLALESRD